MQQDLEQETHNQETNWENRIGAIVGFCTKKNNRELPM